MSISDLSCSTTTFLCAFLPKVPEPSALLLDLVTHLSGKYVATDSLLALMLPKPADPEPGYFVVVM